MGKLVVVLFLLMASIGLAGQPDTRHQVLPPGNRAVGEYPFDLQLAPDEATEVELEIDRVALRGAPSGSIHFVLEVSLNGGATWRSLLSGVSSVGALAIGGKGNTVGSVRTRLPDGTGRWLRGRMVVNGRAVPTKMELIYGYN